MIVIAILIYGFSSLESTGIADSISYVFGFFWHGVLNLTRAQIPRGCEQRKSTWRTNRSVRKMFEMPLFIDSTDGRGHWKTFFAEATKHPRPLLSADWKLIAFISTEVKLKRQLSWKCHHHQPIPIVIAVYKTTKVSASAMLSLSPAPINTLLSRAADTYSIFKAEVRS